MEEWHIQASNNIILRNKCIMGTGSSASQTWVKVVTPPHKTPPPPQRAAPPSRQSQTLYPILPEDSFFQDYTYDQQDDQPPAFNPNMFDERSHDLILSRIMAADEFLDVSVYCHEI